MQIAQESVAPSGGHGALLPNPVLPHAQQAMPNQQSMPMPPMPPGFHNMTPQQQQIVGLPIQLRIYGR